MLVVGRWWGMSQEFRIVESQDADSRIGIAELLLSMSEIFRKALGFSPTIRLASNADERRIFSFLGAIRSEYGVHIPEELEGDLKDIDRYYTSRGGFLLIAERGTRILATFAFARVSEQLGELSKFYIVREFRGLGMGTQMMILSLRYASGLGVRMVQGTTVKRFSGQRLMSKTGFNVAEKDAQRAYKFLVKDAFLMQRQISGLRDPSKR